MVLARIGFFKPLILALLLLVLPVCTIELALRVQHSCAIQQGTFAAQNSDSPVVPSALTYQRLRPLSRFADTTVSAKPVTVDTNSFGLRGPEPLIPKPPDSFRIVCVGDETTFGVGVEEKQTFCVLLQQMLQPRTRLKVEVINAGLPGSCPLLAYLQTRQSLLSLQPNVLLFTFDMGDVADDHRFRRFTVMTREGEPLACPHPDLLPPKKPKTQTFADRLLLTGWCKQKMKWLPMGETRTEHARDINAPSGRYAWIRDDAPDLSICIQQALQPLSRLQQLSGGAQAAFLVGICPAPWQVSPMACSEEVRALHAVPPGAIYENRKPFDAVLAALAPLGVPCLDASGAFKIAERPEDLYLRDSPRLSATGHALYAHELAGMLIQTVPGVWSQEGYGPQTPPARHAGLERPVR